MATMNPKAVLERGPRLAGGMGAPSAVIDGEAELKRLVMANLLWEDLAYIDGKSVSDEIAKLIPIVAPRKVFEIAVEAREKQKLRHVPLFIIREMARYEGHRAYVAEALERVCTRADMATDFLALYLQESRTLSKQVRKGLQKALKRYDAYSLGKYSGEGKAVKMRDVFRMVHPKPDNQEQAELWRKLIGGELETPKGREYALSQSENRAEAWAELIETRKLGALAFLRNLANMTRVGVPRSIIRKGFQKSSSMLLPLNFYAAQAMNPEYTADIETMMLDTYSGLPKLPGYTIFVVDVSGSMGSGISSKSMFNRLQVAVAMATLAREVCEDISIYATAGFDGRGQHKTARVASLRGFGLADKIKGMARELGGGGIFTRQALEFIAEQETEQPDRIIIFSDSQDCDRTGKLPKPFGKNNYIIDVSAHQHGINYRGVWTAEVSGWSEHFLSYIAALEGVGLTQDDTQY